MVSEPPIFVARRLTISQGLSKMDPSLVLCSASVSTASRSSRRCSVTTSNPGFRVRTSQTDLTSMHKSGSSTQSGRATAGLGTATMTLVVSMLSGPARQICMQKSSPAHATKTSKSSTSIKTHGRTWEWVTRCATNTFQSRMCRRICSLRTLIPSG